MEHIKVNGKHLPFLISGWQRRGSWYFYDTNSELVLVVRWADGKLADAESPLWTEGSSYQNLAITRIERRLTETN